MTKYLNFFESESGFTEAVEAGQLFFPNVSYTEEDDTVHWNLEQPVNPVETPMLRMSFSTSSPGQEVNLLRNDSDSGVTAMEIDGIPVNFASGGTYSIAESGNHTAVYQFASSKIPEGLFNSNSGAFDTFTSAEITSPVTEIGHHAFSNCSGLSSVSISDSVTYIGSAPFDNCPLLQSVVLSDNLTTISTGAFRQCPALTSIDIPDSVTTIAFQAFAFTGLRDVTVPDSVTNLAGECFARCGDLQSAVIGSGVTTVGEKAFSGCGGLTAIYLNPETPPTLGTGALDYTNDCPIYVPAASVETYQQAWPAYASRITPMGGVQYNITATVNDDSLGEVSIQETASEGDTVNFHVNVFDPVSSEVMVIQIHDENYNEVQYTDEGDGNYSFTMPASDVNVSVFIMETGRHRITAQVNDDSLGEVGLNQETASEGEPVSFSVDVYDGDSNEVTSVTVTDGNGDEVQVNDEGGNNYGFEMPASDITISVVIGEKPKHTVTVDSTDGHVTDVNFMSDDGEPSYKEGYMVNFTFNLPGDGQFYAASVQASDCDGNSIEVELEDEGDGHYSCYFTMPGCDVSVFVTVEERPMYNISWSVNDDSLGAYDGPGSAPEGGQVEFNVFVFDSEQNQISSVTVTDGNGNNVQVTDEGDNHYSFTMPASDVSAFITIEKKQ